MGNSKLISLGIRAGMKYKAGSGGPVQEAKEFISSFFREHQ